MHQTMCRVEGCEETSPFPEELCPAHWDLVPWSLRVRTIKAKYYDEDKFWYLIAECTQAAETAIVQASTTGGGTP